MSWFKSFWKKLTAPTPAETSSTLRQIFGEPEPGKRQPPPAHDGSGNFTPRAQQVLMLARKEADRLNHNFLGTEHLLLGLIALGQGTAVNVLKKLGVDLDSLRAEIKKDVGIGPEQKIVGNIPYTPRTKKVLELAKREARALNHEYIGTEHILLGLLREGGGVAARVLRNMGLNIEKLRQEILKELDTGKIPGNSPITPAVNSPEQTKSTPSLRPSPSQSQGEPVDTNRRYDVHCTDWSQGVTIYRNVRFKGVKHLFQRSSYDVLSGYVELEQEDGKSVFVSRGSIVRFSESGAPSGA